MSGSKCFCASSLAILLGLLFTLAAFIIVAKMTYEKLDQENQHISSSTYNRGNIPRNSNPNPYPSFQQQPQGQFGQQNQNRYPYSQTQYPVQRQGAPASFTKSIFGDTLDSNSTNTWILLFSLMTVGVVITLLGLVCSNCAFCCCGSGSSPGGRGSLSHSVAPVDHEMKDWAEP